MYNILTPVVILFFLLIKNISCYNSKTKLFYGINVSYTIPIPNFDGSLLSKKNSYEVYYNDDIILYNFFYDFDSSDNKQTILKEKRNYYFIFHKDSSFGYNFYPYSHEAFPEGKLSVDSMLKINTFKNNKFDSLLYSQPDSSFSEINGDSIFVYKINASKESPEIFTIYLTYTKMPKVIKETFSKNIDNIKNMKLSKIRIVAHGAYYKEYKMNMPRREYLYEMTQIPKAEFEINLKYLNKYKQEYLTR